MKVENGDYIVAIDLGTNTVVAMIGTKGEDGRIRVIDREDLRSFLDGQQHITTNRVAVLIVPIQE